MADIEEALGWVGSFSRPLCLTAQKWGKVIESWRHFLLFPRQVIQGTRVFCVHPSISSTPDLVPNLLAGKTSPFLVLNEDLVEVLAIIEGQGTS